MFCAETTKEIQIIITCTAVFQESLTHHWEQLGRLSSTTVPAGSRNPESSTHAEHTGHAGQVP